MAKRPRLIPDDEGSGRFLPWVVAVMTFLAALATAGAVVLGTAMQSWRAGLEGSLTVEVSASGEAPASQRVAKAAETLRGVDGIRKVRVLSEAELAALLEPWLGAGASLADLPVPRLIDVELEPAHGIDLGALAHRLAAEVPGTQVDDHRIWLQQLVRLAQSIRIVAASIVVLIAGAMATVVVFAVRAALAAHHQVVSLLHQMGARDSFVAREFQNHAFLMGVRGGMIGLALAAITLFVLTQLAARVETPMLPALSLRAGLFAALALVPFASGAIAFITARQTVLRALRRMP
ncbi:MAG: cell division protein [Alphaproteobacteria bacterium]|jgi:cell division transport system permease protein|nr:cell division protein [Alphaproteobacteria bacterium]